MYKIVIEEKLSRIVEIEAESLVEAEKKVKKRYFLKEIALDANDFVGSKFYQLNYDVNEKKELINEVIDYLFKDEKKHYEESDETENHIYKKLLRLKELNS